MKRYGLYTRVSSTPQEEGKSLEGQRDALEAYVMRHGGHVVCHYEETASTWTGKRDQYQRMMEDALQGKLDCILVWKLDRFGRRSGEIHTAIEQLRAANVDLILVSENVNLTQDGIVGKVLVSALALTADLENEVRADRSRMADQRRRQLGLFPPGSLPSGYNYGGKYQVAEIDEPVAAGIRRAFELYATGRYSMMDTVRILNEAGHRLRNERMYIYRNLNHILQNRHYLGQIEIDGEWVPGREQPLIDQDTFDLCQRVREQHHGAPRSAARHLRVYLFKGVLYCHHCGNKMYAQTRSDTPKQTPYYLCSTYRGQGHCPADDDVPTAALNEDVLVPQIDEIIGLLCLPPNWREEVQRLLEEDKYIEIVNRRREVKGKLARLNELYIENHIDRSEFDQRRMAYQDDLAQLVIPDRSTSINAGYFLQDLNRVWSKARRRRQNQLLRAIFSRITVDRINQQLFLFEPYPEFDPLFEQIADMSKVDRMYFVNQRAQVDTMAPRIIAPEDIELLMYQKTH